MSVSSPSQDGVGGANRRAAPLIAQFDLGFRYAGTAAWLAAVEGQSHVAAQLLGYRHSAAAASGADAEEPAEITARQRAAALIAGQADEASVEASMSVGAALSTEAAYEFFGPLPAA